MELYEPSNVSDFSFVLILISLTIIGVLKKFYYKHTNLYYSGVFAQRYSNQYLREENVFTERVSFYIYLMILNSLYYYLKFLVSQKLTRHLRLFFCYWLLSSKDIFDYLYWFIV